MAFDLDSYERITAKLDLSGIDFDEFRDHPLAPDLLRCLRYMHDVEHHTVCYLRNLLNTRAHRDPDITRFLTFWNFEEYWHGEAIGRVLEAHHEDAHGSRIASARRRLGWRLDLAPWIWLAVGTLVPDFLAVYFTFGAINEWTTQAGYARLAQQADHPVLSDLLRRIMKQEGRHIDFYVAASRERLDGNRRAQCIVRWMLRHQWKPVGAGVMPAAETTEVIRVLFGGPEGDPFVRRIDDRIDRLPGLAGVRPVAKACDRGPRLAA